MSYINGNEINRVDTSPIENTSIEQPSNSMYGSEQYKITNDSFTTPVSYNLITEVESTALNNIPLDMNKNPLKSTLSPDDACFFEANQKFADGTVSINSVIPPDERQAVTNTQAFPYNTICKLYLVHDNLSLGEGTGFLIDKNHILTAGHCVKDLDFAATRNGWIRSMVVVPGKVANIEPYGRANAIYFRSFAGWTIFEMTEHDFALVTLDRKIGDGMTFLPLHNAEADDPIYTSPYLTVAGYPGDRGPPFGPVGEVIFEHTNNGDRTNQFNHWYFMDTFAGQSGSPVWSSHSTRKVVVSIHTFGNLGIPGDPNHGTRLTENKLSYITDWLKEDAGEHLNEEEDYGEFNTTKFLTSTPGFVTIGSVFSIFLGCILIEKKYMGKR